VIKHASRSNFEMLR